MTTENISSENGNISANLHHSLDSSTTEQLTDIKPIQDTPFVAIRVHDKHFLALGKYRLTELLDSYEEVEKETTHITWNRLTQVIAIICNEEIERRNNHKPTIQKENDNE